MARKFSLYEVSYKFCAMGWELLANEYEGSIKPLSARCPLGHVTTISLNNLTNGQGCRYCCGNQLFTYDYVREYFRNAGCEILDDTYVNSVTPVSYRCTCGTKSRVAFGKFRQGTRCQLCRSKSNAVKFTTPNQKVRDFCGANGCLFVSYEVLNRRGTLTYVCKCGREAMALWENYKRYPNCRECGKDKKRGNKCHMWNPDREAVARNKKFQRSCDRLLRRSFKATGQQKVLKMNEHLGYTPLELQRRILPLVTPEMGPNWQFDHIFPVKAFIDYGIDDLSLINSLDNLQPLSKKDNIRKGDKFDAVEFEAWLTSKTGKL